MNLSKDELVIIREALLMAKRQSETDGIQFSKRLLDNYHAAPNKKVASLIQQMYEQLNRKIENAIEEMKDE